MSLLQSIVSRPHRFDSLLFAAENALMWYGAKFSTCPSALVVCIARRAARTLLGILRLLDRERYLRKVRVLVSCAQSSWLQGLARGISRTTLLRRRGHYHRDRLYLVSFDIARRVFYAAQADTKKQIHRRSNHCWPSGNNGNQVSVRTQTDASRYKSRIVFE